MRQEFESGSMDLVSLMLLVVRHRERSDHHPGASGVWRRDDHEEPTPGKTRGWRGKRHPEPATRCFDRPDKRDPGLLEPLRDDIRLMQIRGSIDELS